jgi:hypothetical protein
MMTGEDGRRIFMVPLFWIWLIEVMAMENDIEEGDEITVSYVDPTWPRELRRQTLKRDYGFDCNCAKCQHDLESQNATLIEI